MPIPIHGLHAPSDPVGLSSRRSISAASPRFVFTASAARRPSICLPTSRLNRSPATRSPASTAPTTSVRSPRPRRRPAARAHGSRHVEAYSWGGTTSKSSSRVLWLLLLPFMLANIAGWACSTKMKQSPLFVWHQRVMRVVCLALTLNVVLVVSFIAADLCAYQAPRAGELGDKWWLWGLRWAPVAGHTGRSLVMGFVVPLVLVAFLARLGTTTADKYEKVRPPVHEDNDPDGHNKKHPVHYASTHSIDEREFFDGEHAVRYAMWLHVAAATAFISILFAATRRAATASPSHDVGLWWIATLLGGGVLVAAVALLAFWESVTEGNARVCAQPAPVALVAAVCAGAYSWVQPDYSVARPQLPGFGTAMLSSFAAFLAVVVVLALVELATVSGGSNRARVRVGAPADHARRIRAAQHGLVQHGVRCRPQLGHRGVRHERHRRCGDLLLAEARMDHAGSRAHDRARRPRVRWRRDRVLVPPEGARRHDPQDVRGRH